MAINQTEKRQNLARQATRTAPMFMNVLYELDALRKQRDSGGPSGAPLAFVDADFSGVLGLAHLDAATVDAFFAVIPTILTAFVSNNFDDKFEALRP